MKTLYLECKMGAAGDMLMAALSELVDQNEFLTRINGMGLEGLEVNAVPSVKCGIHGTHMKVEVNGEEEVSEDVHEHHHEHDHDHHHDHDHDHHHDHEDHHDHDHHHDNEHSHDHEHHHDHDHGHGHHHVHRHMSDIESIISGLKVSDKVKTDAKAVYGMIAEAESHAHDMPVEEIHFHEVGTMDAIADVVGVCMLMEMIGADRIYASPVAVGNGMVRCAHGILPVPAPATAYLLKGIPSYAGNMDGELCTPTGAALLKYFVQSFEKQPVMKTEKIGYGMGYKDFPAANCIRAFLGEADDDGEVVELVCNIDDQTAEEIGFAVDELFAAGALDVYSTPVNMKKNRPGIVFTCMCRADQKEQMIGLMFRHLTTLGIREYTCRRHSLQRSVETVETEFGKVRIKKSDGFGVHREKYEYEDLAEIARREGTSVNAVRDSLKKK